VTRAYCRDCQKESLGKAEIRSCRCFWKRSSAKLMSMLRTRKGRRAVRLFAVVTSVIVAILVLEVLLRILGYSYPILTTTDPTLGLALRPGAEGWYRKEGEAYIRINRDGFR